ncbi:MAG: diacylglycerol kinase family protein [Bacillota bacterium]|nr:diacylglycerol kinase family protein [Bacillota bacterium]
MKHIFIINPIAGQGKYQEKILNDIHHHCTALPCDFEVIQTQDIGEAYRIAAQYPPEVQARFYAVGGDGTLNEMINGLMARGCGEAGLIPCGTGDDFARVFQEKAPFLDIDKQLKGTAQAIDLIRVCGRYAVNLCNLGIDAETAADVHRFSRFLPGPVAYTVALVWRLFHRLGIEMKVTLDDKETFEGTYLLASFANGQAYGGGYFAAPKAEYNDGWMDVCIVKPISRLKFSQLLSQYKAGKHLDNDTFGPLLHYRRVKKAVFSTAKNQRFCIDGEIIATDSAEMEICPQALRFILPYGAKLRGTLPIR